MQAADFLGDEVTTGVLVGTLGAALCACVETMLGVDQTQAALCACSRARQV